MKNHSKRKGHWKIVHWQQQKGRSVHMYVCVWALERVHYVTELFGLSSLFMRFRNHSHTLHPLKWIYFIKAWVKNWCDIWDDHTSHRDNGTNNSQMCQKKETKGFLLGTKGHVIDHALNCVKTIIRIPTTTHIEKLSLYTSNLLHWVGVKECNWNGIKRWTAPLLFAIFC